MPFSTTNEVTGFQRILDEIKKEGLKGTFAYLDDVTVCGTNECVYDTK